MEIKKRKTPFKIELKEYHFVLEDNHLSLSYKGKQVAGFNLAPIVDEKELSLNGWSGKDKEFVAKTREGNFSAHLRFEKYYMIYWLEGDFAHIRSLIYFSGSIIDVNKWQTYVSDKYDTSFDASLDRDVMISSSDLREEMPVETWMMSPQPKACSFHLRGGWLGFSCPLPHSLEMTCFSLRNKKFAIEFREMFPCQSGLPKVFIIPGLRDNYTVLKVHAQIARQLHLVKKKRVYYKWWGYPIFCTWGEQFMSDERLKKQVKVLDEKVVSDWVGILEKRTGIRHFNLIIDNSWFDKKGDFHACPNRFPHMRGFIDRMKNSGHRILLWMPPFFVAMDSYYARNYPETLVKDRRGNVAIEHSYWDVDKDHYLKDYSIEKTREHMKRIIKYCLSNEKGCLNADGFKMDYNFQTPAPSKHHIAYPEWGMGDEMYRKTIEFIYETAHKIKKDALISISGNEVYLQPYMDILRLNDHFQTGIDDWCKRARVASYTLPEILFDTDGWFMNRGKSLEYWIVSPVIGIPSIHHISQFDDPHRLNLPDLNRIVNCMEKMNNNTLSLGQEDFRRLSACWTVYLNCPIDPTMELYIDPERDIFSRKYTKGRFKGFYSALAIERRCLITYGRSHAFITATKNFRIEMPLPPGVRIKNVKKVSHAGYVQELTPEQVKRDNGQMILFEVEDSAGETKLIDVTYC